MAPQSELGHWQMAECVVRLNSPPEDHRQLFQRIVEAPVLLARKAMLDYRRFQYVLEFAPEPADSEAPYEYDSDDSTLEV
ncbi:hypothetical protein D3C71_2073670 [compost metagenome]